MFNGGNTYSGKTLVNGGLLTIASHTTDGVTGMGTSEVTIASPGTLEILASTNSAGDYTLTNALKGDGLLQVQLSSSDNKFGFTRATGTEFAGVAQLKAVLLLWKVTTRRRLPTRCCSLTMEIPHRLKQMSNL